MPGMERFLLLCLTVAVLLLWEKSHATVGSSPASPPVLISLKAHWNRTPLVLEASEYIAEVDEKLFWQFLWQIHNLHQRANTDKECYEELLILAQSLLTKPTNYLLSLSLALHSHSPTVQMFQQVSSEVYASHNVDSSCSEVFVIINESVICSVEELKVALESIDSSSTFSNVKSFDHCYPFVSTLPTAFLYGEMGTEQFSKFLEVFSSKMEAGLVRVCVRHWLGQEEREKLILSGYGVQLAVKNTEYKAMDDTKVEEGKAVNSTIVDATLDDLDGFNFTRLKERYNDLANQLDEFQRYLLDKRKELPQLKAWEISDLGLQATQVVLESEFPFNTLQELSHNLPVQAKTLSRIPVQKELKKEIEYNQAALEQVGISPGDSLMLLNGLILQEDDMDVFSLLDQLKKEARLLAGLQGLGIPSEYFTRIVSLPVHPQHSSFAVDMRNESVLFVNDLEKDRKYSRWASSVTEFLRPTFPGSLRQIRKNAFTIVFVLDPLSEKGSEYLHYVSLFLEHSTPFRLGLLFVPGGCGHEQELNLIGKQFVTAFKYVSNEKGVALALMWALSVLEEVNEEAISWTKIESSLRNEFGISLPAADTLLEPDSQFADVAKVSCDFYLSRGFTDMPQVLVNGVMLDLDDEDLQNAIVNEVQHQTSELQQLVYRRKINDQTNIYDYFMTKPNVLRRLNKHVANINSLKVDLSGVWQQEVELPLTLLTNSQLSAAVANKMSYLFNSEGEFTTKPISLWIVADLTTPTGHKLAQDGLTFTLSKETVRISFLHNPVSDSASSFSLILEAVLRSQRTTVAIATVTKLLQFTSGSKAELIDVLKDIEKFKMAAFDVELERLSSSRDFAYRNEFVHRVLELEPGQSAILSNGRLIGPISANEMFGVEDFEVLYLSESSSHAKSVSETVNDIELIFDDPDDDTTDYRSNLVMRLSSLLRSQPKSRRLELSGLIHTQHSVLSLLPTSPGPSMQCIVFLNPLSTTAQKLSPLLAKLKDILPLNITVVFNPLPKLSELPLKDFYRSVIESTVLFDSDGQTSDNSSAIFASLPLSPLFTLNMDVPHSWMVEAVYSPYDLDNIHLASVEREVRAEFKLEYILVEGQCFDGNLNSPVPGLQYVMGTDREHELYDTIVMANLGYFQLKGQPGAWKLRLREGRSSDIYQITNYYQTGGSSGDHTTAIPVTVASFTSTHLVVHVAKRPGMEKVNLLQSDPSDGQTAAAGDESADNNGGLFDSITKFFSDNSDTPSVKNDTAPTNDTINIFSIASGHLYERFLRIMMLSVLKHTKNPVKFWFLKNYLSPQFKDFIPKMADKYGFEYELVQYKWPRWLHGQTEKQRLIWGYKILFLDVLFPLNIKKIIFVDADQVVRTDMKELLEVPLDGAPYGYTPFCDSRTDMNGFRFWKSGYWKNHLGKRSYHISALYVIDLQRFRLLAAGDRLRGQYQMLSQDPNSLSNLDQDLPNSMIHTVPIKSLPQDWLWCETWCSMESKPNAKTIDLCNNPLTKEPKLVSAVRIIDEWQDYDNEIKSLQESIAKETTTQSSADPGHTHSSLHHHEL